jgi:hypothetical protein
MGSNYRPPFRRLPASSSTGQIPIDVGAVPAHMVVPQEIPPKDPDPLRSQLIGQVEMAANGDVRKWRTSGRARFLIYRTGANESSWRSWPRSVEEARSHGKRKQSLLGRFRCRGGDPE